MPEILSNGVLAKEPTGSEFYTVKNALANPTAAGNTQVVAAVSTKKIRVLSYIVTNNNSSPATVKFQSATTDKTAAHLLAATGGGHARSAPAGAFLFETATSEALNINLAGTGAVACDVTYIEV